MKKTTNIQVILFLILGSTLLFSCKKDKKLVWQALELDRNAIEIPEGYTATVEIMGGNGGYTVSESNLVTVDIQENKVTFTAAEAHGEERVYITDAAGKKAALDIKVSPSVLGSDDPRFYWDNLIELEQANGWATSILDNKIVLTNVKERKQYILTWRGEFEVGVKPRATLQIVNDNNKKETALSKLEIINIDRSKNLCTLVFFKDKQKGELVYVLP